MPIYYININKIRNALRLFKRAYSGYRLQIITITILGFISGLASGIGISMLIPIFSLVAGKENGQQIITGLPDIIGGIFNFFNTTINLPLVLALMVFLFIAKALLSITASYIDNKVSGQYMEDMRLLSYKLTLRASWPYLMNQKVGYLDRIITDDATQSANVLSSISDTILRLTSLAVYSFIAFRISINITLISLAGGTIIFLLLKPVFYKIRKIYEFLSKGSKEISHLINESLIGMKIIKAFGVESAVLDKSRAHFKELKKSQIRAMFLGDLQGILFEPASLIFISLIFAFSYKSRDFNIASFVVIIYLIQKIFSFIQAIQGKINNINTSLPYLESMLNYQELANKNKEDYSGRSKFKFNKSLEVSNIKFTYPGTDNNTLSNVDFSIKKGEMVGIIGPSGAGKTTLVDILLRLIKPEKGTILCDDVDINSIELQDWRKNVGYVSQDVFLINDTIWSNISFYNQSITKDEVIAASKLANIYNFIQELPEKFDTHVGERGVKLSGGQKQRIALARVLARKPSILILDEATSALDNESESLIQESINNLRGQITVMVIAHRLTTIMNADSLIVLDKGKIIESGTPQELIKNESSYLYKSYHIKERQ